MRVAIRVFTFGLMVTLAASAQANVFNMGGTISGGTWTGDASLSFVTVGDPGNAPDTVVETDDTTGYGSVSYVYQMGKYDVTTAQYTAFLNAVATTADRYGLYYSSMAVVGSSGGNYGCGIVRSGSAGSYIYSVATAYENFPVNYITWFDAARFCNWLQNGQPTSGTEAAGTTETGAYTLNGDTTSGTESRNANATYFIPSENEWYKASYYKSGGTNAGYWTYPTQSNTAPGNSLALAPSTSNEANYYNGGDTDPTNYLTPVGTFAASPGPYGTYDMGGDLFQWNDTVINGVERGWRGSPWYGLASNMASSHRGYNYPTDEYYNLGFRVASNEAVPGSSVWAAAIAGNWSDASKWTGGVPNADGAGAVISASTSAAVTITLNEPVTLGTLLLGAGTPGVGYTLSGSGGNTLTFSNTSNGFAATITVTDGTHFIAAPVVLASNLVVTSTSSKPWQLSFGTAGSITETNGAQSLTMNGASGTLTLSGSNSYLGGTTIDAGVLVAGAANALSASSAVTISGGTLVASGFASTVASLNVAGSGSLNLGLGNTLTCSGSAALAGTLNVSGTGTLGKYPLLAYASESGAFASATGLGSNYGLLYKTTELDAEHKAKVGTITVTAVNPTVITGGTTGLTVNVTNSAPSQSDALNLTAASSGAGYGLSTTGSLAAAGSGNFTIANGFNSASLSAGSYTGTVTVTGTNSALGGLALNSGGAATVTVNVLGHSAGSATVTSGNGFLAHARATGLSATVSLSNAAGTRSDLQVNSAPSVSSGTMSGGPATPYYVSAGSAQTYAATFNVGSTPGVFSDTVTFASAGDNQSLSGASSLGSLSVAITGNVYSGKAQWNRPGSGNWSSDNNWSDTLGDGAAGAPGVHGYSGDAATFGASIGGTSAVVTLDTSATVSALTFSNTAAGSYTLSGSGANTLTLNNSGSGATITVASGNHLIDAPVVLSDNVVVSGSGMLAFGNSSSIAGNYSLTMDGAHGTLILSGSDNYTGGTVVEAGKLLVTGVEALQEGTSLTVGANASSIFGASEAGAFDPNLTAATAVPEPGTLMLLVTGTLGLLAYARRRPEHRR